MAVRGSAYTHLEKYSTTTIVKRYPLRAMGRGPTMTIHHRARGQVGTMGWRAIAGSLLILAKRWHWSHLLTSSLASSSAVGQ